MVFYVSGHVLTCQTIKGKLGAYSRYELLTIAVLFTLKYFFSYSNGFSKQISLLKV